MVARPAQRRRRSVERLSTLVPLLATVLVVVSTAVGGLVPGPRDGAAGPVLGAATSGPNATTIRSDVRMLGVRAAPGSAELDLLSSHPQPHRSANSVSGWPVLAAASGSYPAGDAGHNRGRAPPHAR